VEQNTAHLCNKYLLQARIKLLDIWAL